MGEKVLKGDKSHCGQERNENNNHQKLYDRFEDSSVTKFFKTGYTFDSLLSSFFKAATKGR